MLDKYFTLLVLLTFATLSGCNSSNPAGDNPTGPGADNKPQDPVIAQKAEVDKIKARLTAYEEKLSLYKDCLAKNQELSSEEILCKEARNDLNSL